MSEATENSEYRRASEGRACLATRLAVTGQPCRHGYTWCCPEAVDLVAFLLRTRDHLKRLAPRGDGLITEIETALPWLVERRRGPRDRRQ